MHRFEEAHDPLSERVSDAELREVLERLGEAQFGGDERATVGAIVEATGVDAATVLRLLGEVRQKALDAQRRAIEGLERRLVRLEERPAPTLRTEPFTVTPTQAPDDEVRTAKATLAVILAGVLGWMAVQSIGSNGRNSSASGGWSVVMTADTTDGTVVRDTDGNIWVDRRDGSRREPTAREKASVETPFYPSR